MDRITLTLPRERDFAAIADLVLGGLAARLDVTIEHIDDLQLALESLLEREEGSGDVTVTLAVDGDRLDASVGPFAEEVVRDLTVPAEGMGLKRLLETVVDRVTVAERDGGAWVELSKRLAMAGGEGGSA